MYDFKTFKTIVVNRILKLKVQKTNFKRKGVWIKVIVFEIHKTLDSVHLICRNRVKKVVVVAVEERPDEPGSEQATRLDLGECYGF